MASVDDLVQVLRRNGITAGGDLARLLDVSPATLSRLFERARDRVVRIGRTRGVRYGLREEVPHVGSTLPVWSIDAAGEASEFGRVVVLHGPAYWLSYLPVTTRGNPGHVYDRIPSFIADMAPQGYLGRSFPDRFPELELPQRLADWNDRHVLQAVARRGEDAVGNLVVGEESMNRLLARSIETVPPEEYPAITHDFARQGAGSSAAGEYPKFTAFDGQRSLIVKFTSGDDSPADRRWRDLLAAEAIASEILRRHGIAAAPAHVRDIGNQRFLEVERFDRVGARGRIATVTLDALDDDLYGQRDNWVAAARRLNADGLLDRECMNDISFLEAFGQLIGNTDRHFGNITFFRDLLPDRSRENLRLAPVYDMLPMMFAPAAGGMVVDRPFVKPTPVAATLLAWGAALEYARSYWQAVSTDARVSAEFRRIAASALETLAG